MGVRTTPAVPIDPAGPQSEYKVPKNLESVRSSNFSFSGWKPTKGLERIDPLLFHALSFKANACFGHTDLFTVTSAVDPYAYGLREIVFGHNEAAY